MLGLKLGLGLGLEKVCISTRVYRQNMCGVEDNDFDSMYICVREYPSKTLVRDAGK